MPSRPKKQTLYNTLLTQPPTSKFNPSTRSPNLAERPFVPRGKPLTTKGKILKTAHRLRQAQKNQNPLCAPSSSENALHAGSGVKPAMNVPKKGKGAKEIEEKLGEIYGAHAEGRPRIGSGRGAISLPPPGEMTKTEIQEKELKARNAAAARRLATRKGAAQYHASKRKPITTQQKILAVKASGVLEKGEKVSQKGDRSRVGGLMVQLERQSASAGYPVCEDGEVRYVPFTSRYVSGKTRREKERVAAAEKKGLIELTVKPFPGGEGRKKGKKEKPFRFLDLPDEIRTRIYRLVVVEEKLCIWPTSLMGRDQPDVSMVNRQVRAEVLPVFYAENTFVIDISPQRQVSVKNKIFSRSSGGVKTIAPVTGLRAVKEWAMVLSTRMNEGGKWFAHVKRWGFQFMDPDAGLSLSVGDEEDKSFIVSIRPPETVYAEEIEDELSPLVEIHREAACFMPGWGECGHCIVNRTPLKLNASVIAWQAAGAYMAEELSTLAEQLQKLVEELSEARCEQADGE